MTKGERSTTDVAVGRCLIVGEADGLDVLGGAVGPTMGAPVILLVPVGYKELLGEINKFPVGNKLGFIVGDLDVRKSIEDIRSIRQKLIPVKAVE